MAPAGNAFGRLRSLRAEDECDLFDGLADRQLVAFPLPRQHCWTVSCGPYARRNRPSVDALLAMVAKRPDRHFEDAAVAVAAGDSGTP